jgi:hypothetical protein
LSTTCCSRPSISRSQITTLPPTRASDIFPSSHFMMLISLSFMSQRFGGRCVPERIDIRVMVCTSLNTDLLLLALRWHRLYSSEIIRTLIQRRAFTSWLRWTNTSLLSKTGCQSDAGNWLRSWKVKHFLARRFFLFRHWCPYFDRLAREPKLHVFAFRNLWQLSPTRETRSSSWHLIPVEPPTNRVSLSQSRFEEYTAESLDKTFESRRLLPLRLWRIQYLLEVCVRCRWRSSRMDALKARSGLREITDLQRYSTLEVV